MKGAADLDHSRRRWALPANAPEYLLAAAVLCSGVLLVVLSSQGTWRYDDWFVLFDGQDWSIDSLLVPQYEHIVLARNLIYKTLLAGFGMDSQIPFAVVATAVFLLSAVLLFVYMRRRVGPWLALIGATIVLFLGAAWEDLVWPMAILHFGAMAAGLGAILALEREDRFGDRLACVLLTVSVSFFTLGFVFLAGALVDVALRRDVWRKRLYIVAVPVVLWGLWWLGWGREAETTFSLHDFGAAPEFMLEAMAAGIASVLGLAGTTSVSTVGGSLDWGRPLLPVVLVLVVWRLRQLEKVPRSLWIVLVVALSSWYIGGLAQQLGRAADASRYQYPSAIFILMIAAELMRGVRISRGAMVAIAVVGVAAVMGNLTQLFDTHKIRKAESEQEKAAFAAIEIARDREPAVFVLPSGDPGFNLFISQNLPYDGIVFGDTPESSSFKIEAGEYLEAVDEFGSPAYSARELFESPEAARATADRVLAAALSISLEPRQTPAAPGEAPPTLIGPPEALQGSGGGCLQLDSSATSPPLLDLPPGGASLVAGPAGEFQVRLRRFSATTLPIDLGSLAAGTAAEIEIPTDRSKQPWKLSLDGAGPVKVCGR